MLKKSIIALALGILFVMTSLFSVAGDILESSDENEYPVMELDEYPVIDFEVIPISYSRKINPEEYYGMGAKPIHIQYPEELYDLKNQSINSDEFDRYCENFMLEFNAGANNYDLIVFPVYAPQTPTEYFLDYYKITENNGETTLTLYLEYDPSGVLCEVQTSLIAVKVEKFAAYEADNIELVVTKIGVLPDILIKGDVNGNGKVDQYDYILAARSYFGTIELNPAQFERADIDGNGVIDQYDYILIARVYFGTYTFPAKP